MSFDELKVSSIDDVLNTLVADEFFASLSYKNAAIVAQGSSLNECLELFDKTAEDEYEDHLVKLVNFAQSIGIGIQMNLIEMSKNCTTPAITVGTAENTEILIKKLIDAELKAIEAYKLAMKNERIREEYPELINIFADILCDEREHKKELEDVWSSITNLSYPADEHPDWTNYDDEKYMIPIDNDEDEAIFDDTVVDIHESSNSSFIVNGIKELFG